MATTDRRGVSVDATDTPIAGNPNPGLAIKAPALVATNGNITLSGVQAIDGVTVGNNNERVLVWQQTDATTNGLYNASSGAWTRTIDMQSNDQVADGMLVVVARGSTFANTQFQVTASDPITIGTTALSFASFISGLAPVDNAVLITSPSGVPSFSTAIPNGVTATTQAAGDDTTKLATTAHVFGNYGGLATANSWAGAQHITNATAATSVTSGALVIDGGLGVDGAVWSGNGTLAAPAAVHLNNTATATVAPIMRLDSSYAAFSSVPTIDMTLNNTAANIIARIGFAINNADSSGDLVLYATPNFIGNNTAEIGRIKGGAAVQGLSISATTTSTSPSTGSINSAGGMGIAGPAFFGKSVLSIDPGSGIGYGPGSGGPITQTVSRATGVTLNKINGAITLVSAAGSATFNTFTVTNSAVAATDVPKVSQKSGADKYIIHVTAVRAGSFDITFATTGGTTTEQPVFNFFIFKAVAS